SDPGVNDSPWAVDINWGDSTAHTTFNSSTQGSLGAQDHTYADNGTYTVTVKVTDKDGGSDSKTFDVIVSNVAPTVTLSGPASASEGQAQHYTYTTSDPGQDSVAVVAITAGPDADISNQQFDSATGAGSFDVTFRDGPNTSTVSVQVQDSDAASNVS